VGEHNRGKGRESAYWRHLPRELRVGVSAGLLVAAVYAAVASVIFLFRGSRPFAANDVTLSGALLAYFAAGVLGGVAYGLLHPLGRWLAGQLLIATICAMLAFMAIKAASVGPPTRWASGDWSGVVVLGLLFGQVGGWGFRRVVLRQ
jgi:hypothetical protein